MEKNYITYEYMTKTVKKVEQSKVMDIYEAFGWEIANVVNQDYLNNVTITFKRDRKLKNKQEINRLQRSADETLTNLHQLEKAKTQSAFIFSLIFGIIGSLVLGGGMSCIMTIENNKLAMIIGIVLGVIGIIMCAINYSIYKKMVSKNITKVMSEMDALEEKLADICENADVLLQNSIL